MTQKARNIKDKINKLDLTKIKNITFQRILIRKDKNSLYNLNTTNKDTFFLSNFISNNQKLE